MYIVFSQAFEWKPDGQPCDSKNPEDLCTCREKFPVYMLVSGCLQVVYTRALLIFNLSRGINMTLYVCGGADCLMGSLVNWSMCYHNGWTWNGNGVFRCVCARSLDLSFSFTLSCSLSLVCILSLTLSLARALSFAVSFAHVLSLSLEGSLSHSCALSFARALSLPVFHSLSSVPVYLQMLTYKTCSTRSL